MYLAKLFQLLLFGAVLGVVAPAHADNDDKARKQLRQTYFTGTFEAGFAPQGILQYCEPIPGLPATIVIRATYSKLAGVCDDQSDRPCAGRFTRLTERCFAEQTNYPAGATSGSAAVTHKVRICYDATAAGHCDEVDEIASGEWHSQFTSGFFQAPDVPPGSFDESLIGIDKEVIKRSRRVEVDGRRVRVPRGTAYGQSSARLTDQCLFVDNACPQVGSLLR